ncbi:hypothetical protein CN954_04790 [Bacillus cereus]|uniref:O-antigen ligase family protein n=2 Tax=Bacillus cereus TaxID=1396 RepID=UPI000BFB6A2C|nr:O-antigen ligase family protein [Bacillus cereus]PGN14713.1 hypothetical protein CN954_04790 [Bacillus cereus]
MTISNNIIMTLGCIISLVLGGLVILDIQTTILLMIFLIWGYICFKNPTNLLYTLVFLIPFRDIHLISLFWVKNSLIFLLIMILIIKSWKGKINIERKINKISILIFCFVLCIIISLFKSYYNIQTSMYDSLFTSINFTLTNILLFIIAKKFISTEDELKKLFKVVLCSFVVIAVLGIIQYYFESITILIPYVFSPYYYGRVTSTFDNPNYLGTFLSIGCGMWFIQMLNTKKKLNRILSGISLLIIFLAVVFTYSRFSLVLSIVAIFLGIYLNLKSKKSKVLLLIIVPIGIYITMQLIIPFLLDYRMSKVYEGSSFQGSIIQRQSDDMRFSGITAALEAIRQHPFGLGYGTFTNISSNYNTLGININTHNEYMRIWVELGFSGLICFALISIMALIQGFKKINTTNNPIYMAFLIGMIIYALGNFTLNSLENIQLIGYFWVILGVLTADSSKFKKSRKLE